MATRQYVYDFSFPTAAARLAATPSIGDEGKVARQFDDNSYWTLLQVTPSVKWSPLVGSVGDEDTLIYVDAATGNDAAIGSQTYPLASLDEALARLPQTWKKKCRIYLSAATYTLNGGYSVRVGRNTGIADNPLLIIGTMSDLVGTRTISSVVDSSGVLSVRDNTFAPTLDQYHGRFVRFTSGAAVGVVRLIRGTAVDGTVDLNAPITSSKPVAGDTFVIEQPGTIISFNSSVTFYGSGGGALDMGMQALRWVSAGGSLNFIGKFCGVQTEVSLNTNRTLGVLGGSFYGGPTSGLPVAEYLSNLNLFHAGVYVHDGNSSTGIQVGQGSSLIGSFVLGSVGVTASGPASALSFWNLEAKSSQLRLWTASEFRHVTYGGTGRIRSSPSNGLLLSDGSLCSKVQSLDVSSCAGDGILLDYRSHIDTMTSVTGSGNTGVGLNCQHGSQAYVAVGVTLTGTGGDCKAGASTATLASILGGTPLVDANGFNRVSLV
jgi:hypothetical protein